MAEATQDPSAPSSASGTRSGAGFELRLERGGAYVRLADQAVAPGVRVEVLTLQVPDVKFPFDVGQGAGQFRHRLADLVELSVAMDADVAAAAIARAGPAAFGVEDVRVAFRAGFAEVAGRLSGGPAFTLAAGLLPAADQAVSLVFHSPRVYGPGPFPAAALAHLARGMTAAMGADALAADPLGSLLRRILAPRGWKLPRLARIRLARAEISEGVARLAWQRDAGVAIVSSDRSLLAAAEGARAFAGAEALVASGDYPAARERWLALGSAATSHAFGVDRILSLLAADEPFHDEALDVSADWLARNPAFPPALLAEANVRLARGEGARAARALAELAAGAAARGEAFSALAAAEASFSIPDAAREDALRAAEVALSVRRDHVPALRALSALAAAAGDREALLRANRRIVAYDVDGPGKARAHAELGELLITADPPAARLHLDHALRLAPDDPAALAVLARACVAGGDPSRAVRALDRLREVLAARGDRAGAARAALDAGALLADRLGSAESALLRFREACELAPTAEAHAGAARAAERTGHWAEAADHHAFVLASVRLDDPAARTLLAETRLALAAIAESRLEDPRAAATHLEAAAALAPERPDLLRRLAALHGAGGRHEAALAALDRLAPLVASAEKRATTLAEAGAAALALGRVDDARSRFAAALAADPRSRAALEGAEAVERLERAERGGGADDPAAPAKPVADARAVGDRAEVAPAHGPDVSGPGASVRAEAAGPAGQDEAATEEPASGARVDLAAAVEGPRPQEHAGAAPEEPAPLEHPEVAPVHAADPVERARLLAREGRPAEALAALRELAGRGDEPDDALELRADLAARAGEPREAAAALLARALRARDREEALAAERLVEAGLAALAADVPGGEDALRDALARAPERETARAALEALAARAQARGDGAAEEAALATLVPLLPTGKRPAALLRHAALVFDAGDAVRARAIAEEARALAPRDLAAVERCRALAEAAGDRAAVAARLAELAALDPAQAGERLLERARLLEAIGDVEAADEAYGRAAKRLPPDRAVADAHARLRRRASLASPSEPLEAYARRAPSPDAARALRAAAAIALEGGDWAAATRAARRAFARTQDDLAFAGPLLARVLYLRGAAAEALVLHRRLFEGGLEGIAPEDAITVVEQLAELAEDAGERDLAVDAYDRLLALRPHDVSAARRRFALDPDRRRAVRVLAEAADASRSARASANAFVEAADAAVAELSDVAFAERLLRGAAAAASRDPEAAAEVARRRAALQRDQHRAGSEPDLVALREAAEEARRAGERATARDLFTELAAAERDRGDVAAAGQDLLTAKALADEDGDAASAARLGRDAGVVLLEGGDIGAAMDALGEAVARDMPQGAAQPLLAADDDEGAQDPPRHEASLPPAPVAPAGGPATEESSLPTRSHSLPTRSSSAGSADDAPTPLPTRSHSLPTGSHSFPTEGNAAETSDARATPDARVMSASSAGSPDGFAQTTPGKETNDSGSGQFGHDAGTSVDACVTSASSAGSSSDSPETTPGREANDSGSGVAGVAGVARAAGLAEAARRLAGEARGAGLREAARAFFGIGEDERARALLVEAYDAWPADAGAFSAALRAAAGELGRLDAVLSARARAVPVEAAACHRARADALGACGEVERAIAAYDAALEAAPDDVATLAALAGCLASVRGDEAAEEVDRRIAALADASPPAVPPVAEAPSRYRLGLAACSSGRPEDGIPHLERAVLLAPDDLRAPLARAALGERADGADGLAQAGFGDDQPEGSGTTVDAEAEREAARDAAERALAETDPALRAAAFVESAQHLLRAAAPGDEIRVALDLACDADPDALGPWQSRAWIEAALGNPVEAARAHLSASIRAEGDEAAQAALEAARLFEDAGQPANAARAYRAALHARPDAVPERILRAAEALAAGDPGSAADHLAAIPADELAPAARERHARSLTRALAAAGRLEAGVAIPDGGATGWTEEPSAEASASDASPPPGEAGEARLSDPIVSLLRSYADAAQGAERADALESLAGHLERAGDRAGAADALIAAIVVDPERDLTYAWLESLVEGDPGRLARAEAARAGIPEMAVPPGPFVLPPERPAVAAAETEGVAAVEEQPVLAEFTPSAGAPTLEELPAWDDLQPAREAPRADELREVAELAALDDLAEWDFGGGGDAFTATSTPTSTSTSTGTPTSPADLAARGREHLAAEEWPLAHELLFAALQLDPTDLTVARDLSRVAEKVGRYAEYVELGELCADAIAAYDPLAAAARYRHFAEVIRARLDDAERAAVMLEKALALVPDDPDTRRELVALLGARPETAPRALDAWLELARRDPSDSEALRAVAELSATLAATASGPERARLEERARLASSLAAFVSSRTGPDAPPIRPPARIDAELRARVAVPGAIGPLAQLLALLAPWLESLFPADLARRGARPSDRLVPPRAPALREALDAAALALGGRPLAPFLVSRPGFEVSIENTQPPAVIVTTDAAGLPAAGLAFLAARAVDLVAHGWALAGKFAPRDVAILLELACRFAGGAPRAQGLPAERAGAFLAVLEGRVPRPVGKQAAALAEDASRELGELDARLFATALRQTANRVALLHAGDPCAALDALARGLRGEEADGSDPAKALLHPDLRDLALFALSDTLVELGPVMRG